MSLTDLMHEVPHLLDVMPSSSLAALLAVSRTHRRQIHEHVWQIAVPDQAHSKTLITGTWPRLQKWWVGDSLDPAGVQAATCYSLANANDAVLLLLAKGYLPGVTHLCLSKGSISAAGMARLHDRWRHLERCSFDGFERGSAAIQEFCAHTWPALQRLDLSHNDMEDAAITHLGAASWPCLKELNLSCTGLSRAAFQQLCVFISSSSNSNSCWSALTHLNVSGNNMYHGRVSTQWPVLTRGATSWTCQLKLLNLSDNSLTASAIQQLTKFAWPCLEFLYLGHTSTDTNAMSYLVRGRWPKLSVLDISGVAVGAPALQMLLACTWPLRSFLLTANLRDIEVFQLFGAACVGQEEYKRLHLEAANTKRHARTSCVVMACRQPQPVQYCIEQFLQFPSRYVVG